MRQINEAGFNLIKHFEGCQLKVYKDLGGLFTVGYGHRTTLPEGFPITQAWAEDVLREDLEKFETGVLCQVKVPITDNQFSALVPLAFNIGLGNFKDSTLLHRLNEGKYKDAAQWFLPWHKVHGAEVEGLLKRRLAERALFLTPDPFPEFPAVA